MKESIDNVLLSAKTSNGKSLHKRLPDIHNFSVINVVTSIIFYLITMTRPLLLNLMEYFGQNTMLPTPGGLWPYKNVTKDETTKQGCPCLKTDYKK